jgi:hypothetical protein
MLRGKVPVTTQNDIQHGVRRLVQECRPPPGRRQPKILRRAQLLSKVELESPNALPSRKCGQDSRARRRREQPPHYHPRRDRWATTCSKTTLAGISCASSPALATTPFEVSLRSTAAIRFFMDYEPLFELKAEEEFRRRSVSLAVFVFGGFSASNLKSNRGFTQGRAQ